MAPLVARTLATLALSTAHLAGTISQVNALQVNAKNGFELTAKIQLSKTDQDISLSPRNMGEEADAQIKMEEKAMMGGGGRHSARKMKAHHLALSTAHHAGTVSQVNALQIIAKSILHPYPRNMQEDEEGQHAHHPVKSQHKSRKTEGKRVMKPRHSNTPLGTQDSAIVRAVAISPVGKHAGAAAGDEIPPSAIRSVIPHHAKREECDFAPCNQPGERADSYQPGFLNITDREDLRDAVGSRIRNSAFPETVIDRRYNIGTGRQLDGLFDPYPLSQLYPQDRSLPTQPVPSLPNNVTLVTSAVESIDTVSTLQKIAQLMDTELGKQRKKMDTELFNKLKQKHKKFMRIIKYQDLRYTAFIRDQEVEWASDMEWALAQRESQMAAVMDEDSMKKWLKAKEADKREGDEAAKAMVAEKAAEVASLWEKEKSGETYYGKGGWKLKEFGEWKGMENFINEIKNKEYGDLKSPSLLHEYEEWRSKNPKKPYKDVDLQEKLTKAIKQRKVLRYPNEDVDDIPYRWINGERKAIVTNEKQ